MKLWDKGYNVHNIVDKFTVGKDRILDLELAKYDVLGNKAHAKMLQKIGILSKKELKQLLEALTEIEQQIHDNQFTIEENFEDIHSKIEYLLVEKLGDVGKKIHTARSRNDQVLVDLHLYTKDQIKHIKQLISELFETLLNLAEEHQHIIIPGYTHLQIAMPSSFGLWFSGYAESLIDDMIMLNAAYQIADQNPLGSAAGYGSSFPIDRKMTTELLRFSTLKYNVTAAQMSRGKLEKTTAFALASVAGTLGKFASDVCLYINQNYNFISFPKELTTGSSIMPHKKNPDVFELIRAKSNKIQQIPAEIMMITTNLPSGYHRDFQLLKENFMEGIELLKDNLEVTNFMLQHIKVNEHIIEDAKYDYLYSVEKVNQLVMEGLSFREAYREVGKEIEEGKFSAYKTLNHTHEGSLGNLCLQEIKQKFQKVM